mgnify:CR=1 FL=1
MWQNDWYLLYLLQKEHHLDLIREADLNRLLRTSRVYVPRRPALYKRLFYWVGRLMITLGTHLTKRFEPVPNDLCASSSTIHLSFAQINGNLLPGEKGSKAP